jgi:hypothetical protein
MEQGMLNNQQREQMQGIAALGRNEDTYLAHVAPDEMIVPAQALRDNPLLKIAIEKSISNYGIDPNQFLVGNGSMDLNPLTGLPEFGFLSKLWKKAKKIVKVVAPIAINFIPGIGPLAKAALTTVAGKASGLSTKQALLGGALSYGGSKLFGGTPGTATSKGGSFFTGGGADGIGRFGKVGDFFGNVKKGIGSLFGGGQQPYTDAEIGSMLETMDPSMVEQAVNQRNLLISQGSQSNLGRIEDLFKTVTGDDGMTRTEELVSAGYTPEQIEQAKANGTFNALVSQARADGKVVSNRGVVGGLQNLLSGNNDSTNQSGMFGGNLGLMGLSALAGKIAYDSAKDRMGGLAETPKVTMDQLGRYQMAQNLGTGGSRADFGLAPAQKALEFNMGGPVYGYNYGGPVRQYFNKGGLALVEELDMRDGGESDGPGTGTSDDIPAMLSDGEFVMTAKATKGAGAFGVNKTKSGIELIKGGSPSRKKGVENMRELMNIFEAI